MEKQGVSSLGINNLHYHAESFSSSPVTVAATGSCVFSIVIVQCLPALLACPDRKARDAAAAASGHPMPPSQPAAVRSGNLPVIGPRHVCRRAGAGDGRPGLVTVAAADRAQAQWQAVRLITVTDSDAVTH